jgi:hypothetical protein
MYNPKLSADPIKRDDQLHLLHSALPDIPLITPELPAASLGDHLQTYTLGLSQAIESAIPQKAKSRRHFYEGWSPLTMALQAQLTALTEIRRFCLGHHGRTRWSTLISLQTGLATIINNWSQRHNRLTLPPDQFTDITFWINLALPTDFVPARSKLLFHLLTSIPNTLRRLQGRKRHERRKQFSAFTCRMELAREQRKYGTLIRHLLGSKQQSPDLTSLLSCENTVLTDPRAIHDSCTRSANAHFSPMNTRNVFDTSLIDWTSQSTVLASKHHVIAHATSTIPASLRTTFQPRIEELWLGLSYPFQHPDLSDRMDTHMTQIHCPTFEEFSKLLQRKQFFFFLKIKLLSTVN